MNELKKICASCKFFDKENGDAISAVCRHPSSRHYTIENLVIGGETFHDCLTMRKISTRCGLNGRFYSTRYLSQNAPYLSDTDA